MSISVPKQRPAQSARPLGDAELRPMLDGAIEQQAAVRVRPLDDAPYRGSSARGSIMTGCDAYLTLRLVADQVRDFDLDTAVCVEVTTDAAVLRFETSLTHMGEQEDGYCLLRAAMPSCAMMVDRRQSPRRRLADSTPVELRVSSGDGYHCCTGAMLNLSGDGMALRAAASDTTFLKADDQVAVAFQAGDRGEGFEFDAVIANVMPAGTEGLVLIGLRFHGPAHRSGGRTRLLSALAGSFGHSTEDPA